MSNPDFTLVRKVHIPNLNLEVEEYFHSATGAKHLHLAADDSNNVFLVAFLTVPQDSTGVAHILEHTSLCGSKKYPVRDPFFWMTRRSLNTFMNAFTSNDWTAYPFASQNTKDFDNLLQVYLDATFFPNLNELDFAQEGHRVEFSTPNDPSSELEFKGIVFNEMKGALSSATSLLWHELYSHLFPTTTYHYNSGGDPQEITNLTHEQLKTFHANHYHPSNAIFMTYGDRPAAEHQEKFQQHVLQHFQKMELNLQIPDEKRYDSPQHIKAYYPVDKRENKLRKTHIVLAWLLGNTNDIRHVMNVNLLAGILLDNSASPLRYALETTDLGTSPSPLCGFDDSIREGIFMCGLEGSDPEKVDEVEALILQVLNNIVDKPVPEEQIESVLHQIELSQREITGDRFPYGLNLLVSSLTPMLHGGDPIAVLDIEPALATLREDCKNPNFISNLIKELLLGNGHRVRLVMIPDGELAAKQLAEEKAKLVTMQEALTEADKTKIIEQTAALEARQHQEEDPELLPKVGLEDIADDLKIPVGNSKPINDLPTTWFDRGTNGMVYQTLVIDLPDLDPELIDVLPLFCDCMTEFGCGEQDYQTIAKRQSAVTGGIYARSSLRGSINDTQKVRGVFTLSAKALVRNQAKQAELLRDTWEQVKFDELSRLRELIAQIRAASDSSVTARGHNLVMSACSSGISPTGEFNHRWHGLVGLQSLRKLDDSLDDENNLADLAAKMAKIHSRLLEAPRQLLVVSEQEHQAIIAEDFAKLSWESKPQSVELFEPQASKKRIKQVWTTNTQVNFCAKAYAAVPIGHADAPALVVLANFLRNGYLHRVLREQGGAYGGGADYNGDIGAFRFYSYRDPRIIETMEDFDNSLDWLQKNDHEARTLEEAILGVISQIDRPGSPAGEAITSFFSNLHGRTPEWRREFRQLITKVSIDDLKQVAATYLQPKLANVAVLTSPEKLASVSSLRLIHKIL
ncbi:MAG: insulinase family protein [Candidatus Marithrix sp.]